MSPEKDLRFLAIDQGVSQFTPTLTEENTQTSHLTHVIPMWRGSYRHDAVKQCHYLIGLKFNNITSNIFFYSFLTLFYK